MAVNRTEYDYEEPAAIVGIVQDPTMEVIDALAEATTVRAWIERSLTDAGRPMRFFLGAGVGAAFTDVPDVTGPRADGGTFDIRTEVDTEIIATVIGGARRMFGERWSGEVAVRAEQHFADWRSTDRVSGAQGSIDDYLTWGIQFTLAYGGEWRQPLQYSSLRRSQMPVSLRPLGNCDGHEPISSRASQQARFENRHFDRNGCLISNQDATRTCTSSVMPDLANCVHCLT